MATNDEPALSAEMIQALQRSGYLMEARINRVLRQAGWLVDANNYIPDSQSGILREADLIAQRPYSVVENEHHLFSNMVVVECINNDNPVTFMSRVPDDPARVPNYFCLGGLPRTIHVPQGKGDASDNGVPLSVWLGAGRRHRFFDLPTYDMYCTFVPRAREHRVEKGLWRAEQPRDYYEAFRKVIHVREYFQEVHDHRLCSAAEHGNAEPTIHIVHYHHVIVFTGPLIAVNHPDALVDSTPSTGAFERRPHLLYRRSQVDEGGVSGTLIDVIVEDHLPKFLALLDQEARHFCEVLAGKIDQLLPRIKVDAGLVSFARYMKKRRGEPDHPAS